MYLTKQKGISFIELMVALAISSFLVLGLVQLYATSQNNFRFQKGQSENIADIRSLVLMLDKEILNAGFRRRPDLDITQVFKAENGFNAGEVIKQLSNKKFSVRYQSPYPGFSGCSGEVTKNELIEIPYVGDAVEPIVTSIEFDSINKTLLCSSIGNKKKQEEVLIDGVADFRVEYAVAYMNDDKLVEDFVSQPANNTKVLGIRYTALLMSSDNNLSTSASQAAIKQFYGDETKALDRHLYSFLQKTILSRNVSL